METDFDRWLGKADLARIFGVTPRSIDNWVSRGRLPAPDRLPNNRPAWRESVIRACVKSAA
jgi:predicted DNA-binding transcriptional regulator AlpA